MSGYNIELPLRVRDADGAIVLVDNERVETEASGAARRQAVSAPGVEDLLGQAVWLLTQILGRQAMPDPGTGLSRVNLTGTNNIATVNSVTALTTVTTAGNLTGMGGNNPASLPLHPFLQMAAAQRQQIEVIP